MAFEAAKQASAQLYACFDAYMRLCDDNKEPMTPDTWLEYHGALTAAILACQKVHVAHIPTRAEPFEIVTSSDPDNVKQLGGWFLLIGADVPDVKNNYTYDVGAQIFPTSADMRDAGTMHLFVHHKMSLDPYLGCNWHNWREEIKHTAMYKIARAVHPGKTVYLSDREHSYDMDSE